jgi:hypothetical protein
MVALNVGVGALNFFGVGEALDEPMIEADIAYASDSNSGNGESNPGTDNSNWVVGQDSDFNTRGDGYVVLFGQKRVSPNFLGSWGIQGRVY